MGGQGFDGGDTQRTAPQPAIDPAQVAQVAGQGDWIVEWTVEQLDGVGEALPRDGAPRGVPEDLARDTGGLGQATRRAIDASPWSPTSADYVAVSDVIVDLECNAAALNRLGGRARCRSSGHDP